MSDDSVTQSLLDRLRQGDPAAARALVGHVHERLRRLVGRLFAGSFGRLENAHDVDSVLHDGVLRLLPALEEVRPPTVADFFRFAATVLRRVLLDLVRRHVRVQGRFVPLQGDDSGAGHEPSQVTLDPARLAEWTELHARIEAMPADLRDVTDLHFYCGLPHHEAAAQLGLSEKEVKRRWLKARLKIADWWPGGEPFPDLPQ